MTQFPRESNVAGQLGVYDALAGLVCSVCGGALEQASTGRRRLTCSARCRQARRRGAKGGSVTREGHRRHETRNVIAPAPAYACPKHGALSKREWRLGGPGWPEHEPRCMVSWFGWASTSCCQERLIRLQATPAMERGLGFVSQCAWCGVLVAVPSTAGEALGACPACGHGEWWKQDVPVGPLRVG